MTTQTLLITEPQLVHLSKLPGLARNIIKFLHPGDVLALSGELASGKTTLTKALLLALGYSGRVTSPTFVLERRYPIKGKKIKGVAHLDFYRLDEAALESFDWPERFDEPNTLTIIEWPERAWHRFPKAVKQINLEIIDDQTRRLTFSSNFTD